jgi:hypothetical protein
LLPLVRLPRFPVGSDQILANIGMYQTFTKISAITEFLAITLGTQ